MSSSRASSTPATSSNVTLVFCSTKIFALLLPIDMRPPMPPCPPNRRIANIQIPTKMAAGSTHDRILPTRWFSTTPVIFTLYFSSISAMSGATMTVE